MEDVKSKLEVRMSALKSEDDKLSEEAKKLIEQNKVANKRIQEIQARKLQLNGAYQELLALLPKEEKKAEKKVEKK